MMRWHEPWCPEAPVELQCECAQTGLRVKRKLVSQHLCWKFQMDQLQKTVQMLSQQVAVLERQLEQNKSNAETLAKVPDKMLYL